MGRNLALHAFDIFNPARLITKYISGKILAKRELVFRSYLFFSFDPNDDRSHAINSTLGMPRLVRLGTVFKPLPDNLIEALMNRFLETAVAETDEIFCQKTLCAFCTGR